MKSRILFFIAIVFIPVLNLGAEIKLPYFFASDMVLQQLSNAPVWGKANPGTEIIIKTTWDKSIYKAKTDSKGDWKVILKTPVAGGPYTIYIGEGKKNIVKLDNVYLGEVWLISGQSNMEMPMQGYRDQPVSGSAVEILKSGGKKIHWFKVNRSPSSVKLDTVKRSEWKIASPETTGELSATGWFFAKMLSEQLGVHVGLICSYYGGSTVEAWMRPELLHKYGDYKFPEPVPGSKITPPNTTPTALFNGMINPILGYSIKGCIWYQGESNYIWPERYKSLFPDMVADWRKLWGQGDFPFYYAQIAPYEYRILNEANYINSAYIRDAQRQIEPAIKNSGMIVLLDAGDSAYIHPSAKNIAGERFAMIALQKTYGVKTPGMLSPVYSSHIVNGKEVEISFDNSPLGLNTFGSRLTDFEIAGDDKVFYEAKARISGGKVIVYSEKVEKPVAVRYGFKDYVKGVLKGTNGLPVGTFRTDNWEIIKK